MIKKTNRRKQPKIHNDNKLKRLNKKRATNRINKKNNSTKDKN